MNWFGDCAKYRNDYNDICATKIITIKYFF